MPRDLQGYFITGCNMKYSIGLFKTKELSMKKYLGVFLLLLILKVNAQQTNATAGVDVTGYAGTANITVGQQDYFNYSNASGFSNEGVQQPYELFAVNNLWTGATSNWFEASNWSIGVPTNTIGATIPAAPANQPIIIESGIASADSLVIESGAKLTNYGTLTLNGNLSNSGRLVNGRGSNVALEGVGFINGIDTFANLEIKGNYSVGASSKDKIYVTEKLIKTSGSLTTGDKLTLVSTGTGSALIQENGGSLTGKATIQHFTSGAYGYHHFSSPVSAASVNSWSSSFPIIGANGVGAWTSKWGTLQLYNEVSNTTSLLDSGYYNYTSLSGALIPGKGFTAWLNKLPTLSTFGTPNSGTITIPVTRTEGFNAPRGWNLVGNPYPSPISWTALKAINPGLFADASCYLWKSTGGKNGVWQEFNGTASINGAGDIINSSLGFFVYVNASGTLTFDNSVRNYSTLSPVIFGKSTINNLIRISVNDNVSGESDEAITYTSFAASTSRKMLQPLEATNPTIAFSVNGAKASINTLKEIDSTTELQLVINTPIVGSYTLKFDINNTTLPVYLKDAVTGTYTDVKTTRDVAIITTSTETANRFSVVFAKAIPDNEYPITVYPNPSSGSATVKGSHIATIQVIDNLGRVVGIHSLGDANNPNINVRTLSTGTYHFRVCTIDGKVKTIEFIKK